MQMHSFLLMGQSNAAGVGFLSEAEPLDNSTEQLWVQHNGKWGKMFRPINLCEPDNGVSFAESFAQAYAKAHPDVAVGILPCAYGGTRLQQWQPGEVLFDNAVHCAKLAMRSSKLMGVLWHQGEDDCPDRHYPLYYERFQNVKNALREQLGMPKLPFVLGGLGEFLINSRLEGCAANHPKVNAALKKIADDDPYCAFVPSTGLTCNPDNTHFNTKSLNEFGVRYYNAFAKLMDTK